MSNNEDPLNTPIEVEASLTESGLKASAKSRALSSIDRLVGNAIDLVNVRIERKTERERELIKAEKALITAGKDELIKRVESGNSEIVDAVFRSAIRKHKNKEAIVLEALEELKRLPPTSNDPTGNEFETLDEDWLGEFEIYAERFSSEQMKQVFARILAGEIRQPGTFCRTTLRIVSELDQHLAQDFERLSSVRFHNFIPYDRDTKEDFTSFLELEDAGLLSHNGGSLVREYKVPADSRLRLAGDEFGLDLHIRGSGERQFKIPSTPLTRAGRELASLVKADEIRACERIIKITTRKLGYAAIHRVLQIDSNKKHLVNPPIKIVVVESEAETRPDGGSGST